MKTRIIHIYLLLLLTTLLSKNYSVREYTFTTEFSEKRNIFYQNVLYDMHYNYTSSFKPGMYDDVDLKGTKKITLLHIWSLGRSYCLTPKLYFTPTLNLKLTNKRMYHPSENVLSVNRNHIKFRTRSIELSLKPALEFPLREKRGRLSFKPEIGSQIKSLGGTIDTTTFFIAKGGVGITYYREVNKSRTSNYIKRYTSVTVGVLFSTIIHGDNSYGLIFGENIGLYIPKIQSYPDDEIMFYISLGFRMDTPRSEKVKTASTQRKQNQ